MCLISEPISRQKLSSQLQLVDEPGEFFSFSTTKTTAMQKGSRCGIWRWSSANSTNNKCSRPRAENRTPHCPPPCCCTEWRLLTGSLQTQPAGLFRGEKYTYQEITKSHSLAAIERKPSSITPEPQCLLQRSTEEPSIGKHQNVHPQLSGYGRRPTYMQWMMTQPETPRKSCQFFCIDSPSDDHTDSRKSDRER